MGILDSQAKPNVVHRSIEYKVFFEIIGLVELERLTLIRIWLEYFELEVADEKLELLNLEVELKVSVDDTDTLDKVCWPWLLPASENWEPVILVPVCCWGFSEVVDDVIELLGLVELVLWSLVPPMPLSLVFLLLMLTDESVVLLLSESGRLELVFFLGFAGKFLAPQKIIIKYLKSFTKIF